MIRLVITLALALAGCSSPTYTSMRPQRDIPSYAAALDDAPVLTKTMVTTEGPAGVPLGVAVWSTSQQRSDVIVLLHGVLSDHSTWRFVSGALHDRHDLLLVDLPGAGASEMRNPRTLRRHDPAAYSLDGLAPRTAEAVSAALDDRPVDAEHIVIVAHSLGALVTLRMLVDRLDALDRTGDVPHELAWLEHVRRVVLISPVDPAMPYGPPSLTEVATTSGVTIEIGQALGIVRERVAVGTRRSFDDGNEVPREQADLLYDIITDTARRRVAKETLRTILPTVKTDGILYPDWTRIDPFVEQVRALGARDEIEWLLIVGERDDVAPASMAYRLASMLGRAAIIAFSRTKHSPHLERPEPTAARIVEFLHDGVPTGTSLERRIDSTAP